MFSASKRAITEVGIIESYELGEKSDQLSVPRARDIPKKKKNSLLLVWSVSDAFARTNRKSKIELTSSQTLCTSSNEGTDGERHGPED